MDIAPYIDHTNLAPNSTESDILTLCREGLEYNFRAICVAGAWVEFCKSQLHGSPLRLAAVLGFPHGNTTSSSKCLEAETYFGNGADELDMVINIGWMRSGRIKQVEAELALIRKTVPDGVLKLILETCYLNDEQKILACQLARGAGWDFVKTSTGFGTAGATLEDVRLMKSEVKNTMGIKASGGIRDYETALKYIEVGATRIGTSSGPAIVDQGRSLSQKELL